DRGPQALARGRHQGHVPPISGYRSPPSGDGVLEGADTGSRAHDQRMRLRRRDRRDAHRSETPRENETPGRARGLRAGGDRPAEARGRNPRNAGSRGGFRLQEAGGEEQARKSRRARRGRHEKGGPQGGAGEDQALNLHEYQSKGIFRAAGIPVPPGDVVSNVEDALAAAERFGYPVVVKAQVLVGGRGKAGGVKVVRGGGELSREAGRILGMELRGLKVNRGLITPSAKIVLDDNALDRHPDLAAMRDLSAEDPGEIEARERGLSYVKLDGTIGCVVNGAGLAMATMDLIQFHGGKPANFLDIGGSSNPDK